jgi:hypothetical protein
MQAEEIAFNGGALRIELRPPVSPQEMLENMRSAIARGLPEIRQCKPHSGTLAIAAGGPSLRDTWRDLEGYIAAGNGALGYLIEQGIVPHFCAVMDANAHMADVVVADKRVKYLLASNCHPDLFDKLLNAGCDVRLWHPTPDNVGAREEDFAPLPRGGFRLLGEDHPGKFMIGGGTSIGLRLIPIGYVLGFRKFALHGSDASFRGNETHAYYDRRWGEWAEHSSIEINGYRTSLNFMQHVTSFANLLTRFSEPRFEPVEIEMFGDGLMQACYRHWQANKDHMSPTEAFQAW